MNEGKAMDAALDRISQLMVENEALREFIATMTLEGEQHGLANPTTQS